MGTNESTFRIGLLIKQHRGKKGLREAGRESGVGASTLSRLERGVGVVGLETAQKLSTWLGIDIREIYRVESQENSGGTELSHLDRIILLVQTDPKLTKPMADMLCKFIKGVYESMVELSPYVG